MEGGGGKCSNYLHRICIKISQDNLENHKTQWFLTLFAPWTSKDDKTFQIPNLLLGTKDGPLNPCNVGLRITLLLGSSRTP